MPDSLRSSEIRSVTVEGVITDERIPLVILSVGDGEVNHRIIKLMPAEARQIAADLISASHQIEDDTVLWNFLVEQGLGIGGIAEGFMHNLSRYRAEASGRLTSFAPTQSVKETKQ